MKVLQCGTCEPLKAGVHAAAFGLAVVCGLYNTAAWLSRRQRHLAVNAIVYTALAIWEQRHVAHHIAALPRASAEGDTLVTAPVGEVGARRKPRAA